MHYSSPGSSHTSLVSINHTFSPQPLYPITTQLNRERPLRMTLGVTEMTLRVWFQPLSVIQASPIRSSNSVHEHSSFTIHQPQEKNVVPAALCFTLFTSRGMRVMANAKLYIKSPLPPHGLQPFTSRNLPHFRNITDIFVIFSATGTTSIDKNRPLASSYNSRAIFFLFSFFFLRLHI